MAASSTLETGRGFDMQALKGRNWRAKARPEMMLSRTESELQKIYDKDVIDVVNDFHAYCLLCDCHVYARSDATDLFSVLPQHFNNVSHRILMSQHEGDFVSDGKEGHIQCMLCGEELKNVAWTDNLQLEQLLLKHVNSGQHKYAAMCLENEELSFLRTVALLSPTEDVNSVDLKQGNCRICDKSYSYNPYAHQKTYQHLMQLQAFMEKEFTFKLTDMNNDKALSKLISDISAWQGKEKTKNVHQKKSPKKVVQTVQRIIPDFEVLDVDAESYEGFCNACKMKLKAPNNASKMFSSNPNFVPQLWKDHMLTNDHIINLFKLKRPRSKMFDYQLQNLNISLAELCGLSRRTGSDESYMETVDEALELFYKSSQTTISWVYLGINLMPTDSLIKTFQCDACGLNKRIATLKNHIDVCVGLENLTGYHSFTCDICDFLIVTRLSEEEHKAKERGVGEKIDKPISEGKKDLPDISSDEYLQVSTAEKNIFCILCETKVKNFGNSSTTSEIWKKHTANSKHFLNYYKSMYPGSEAIKGILELTCIKKSLKNRRNCWYCTKKKDLPHDHSVEDIFNGIERKCGMNINMICGLLRRAPSDGAYLKTLNSALRKHFDNDNNWRASFPFYMGLDLKSANAAITNFKCDACGITAEISRLRDHIDFCAQLQDLTGYFSYTCQLCKLLVISKNSVKNHTKLELALFEESQQPTGAKLENDDSFAEFDSDLKIMKCLLCVKEINFRENELCEFLKDENILPESWEVHATSAKHIKKYFSFKYPESDLLEQIVRLPDAELDGKCVFCKKPQPHNHSFSNVYNYFKTRCNISLVTFCGIFRRAVHDTSYWSTVKDALNELVRSPTDKEATVRIYLGINLRPTIESIEKFKCDGCGCLDNLDILKNHIDACAKLKDLTGIVSICCQICQLMVVSRLSLEEHEAKEHVEKKEIQEPLAGVNDQPEGNNVDKALYPSLMVTPSNEIYCSWCSEVVSKLPDKKPMLLTIKTNPRLPGSVQSHLSGVKHFLLGYKLKYPAMAALKALSGLPGVRTLITKGNQCEACRLPNSPAHADTEEHLERMTKYLYMAYDVHLFHHLGLLARTDEEIISKLTEINDILDYFLKIRRNLASKKKNLPVPFPMAWGINLKSANPTIDNIFCDNCLSYIYVETAVKHFERCIIPEGLENFHTFSCDDCHAVIVTKLGIEDHKTRENDYQLKLAELKKKKDHQRAMEQLDNIQFATILKLSNIPDDENVESLIYNALEKFGEVEKIQVCDKNTAQVRFWIQTCAKLAHAQKTLMINESAVVITKLSFDDGYQPAALTEQTILQLKSGQNLEVHCKELAATANGIYRNPLERSREDLLLKHLYCQLSQLDSGEERWQLLPFGSRHIGLALKTTADLDLFAGIKSSFYGQKWQEAAVQKNFVFRMERILMRAKEFKMIKAISRARVPIVRFTHLPTGLCCDLSFLNGLSVMNSELVQTFIKMDERVAPMILYIKEWISQNGFKDLLTSYAASILVINYLGQLSVPVLPTLAMLRKRAPTEIFINGWNATFDEKFPWLSHSDSSVTKLLAGFFQFYSKFDFNNYVVYPVNATKIPRSWLLNPQEFSKLPEEFDLCSKYFDSGSYEETIGICVMDPFNFNHNITSRMRKYSSNILIDLFSRSAALLTHYL